MGCEAGQCKTSTPQGIFIVTPSLEGWPNNAKEAPPPYEVRLALLDTNPVFQCLRENTHRLNPCLESNLNKDSMDIYSKTCLYDPLYKATSAESTQANYLTFVTV